MGGSIGPLGVRLQPYGRVDPEEAFDAYREQAAALAEAGVDVLVIETQTDLRELEQAVAACREAAPGVALLASATFTRDDRTLLGDTPDGVARRLLELEVDAVGVNCGEGPAQMLRVIRDDRAASSRRAGRRSSRGRTPAARRRSAAGSSIRRRPSTSARSRARSSTRAWRSSAAVAAPARRTRERSRTPSAIAGPALGSSSPRPSVAADASAATAAPPTKLQAAIAAGDLVVTVEMEPPRSFNAAQLVAAAETLRDAGATAIDVADSPMAKMRMSAWAACRLVHEQVGIETVLHFPTRGRNILRLQGDLLGAHALGIRNLFVCVGDPVTIGDYPHGSNDVDVTATGLLQLITEHFNTGVDRAGLADRRADRRSSPAPPPRRRRPTSSARCGCSRRKVAAGARFVLTQPVYAVEPAPRRSGRRTNG